MIKKIKIKWNNIIKELTENKEKIRNYKILMGHI